MESKSTMMQLSIAGTHIKKILIYLLGVELHSVYIAEYPSYLVWCNSLLIETYYVNKLVMNSSAQPS